MFMYACPSGLNPTILTRPRVYIYITLLNLTNNVGKRTARENKVTCGHRKYYTRSVIARQWEDSPLLNFDKGNEWHACFG